MDSGTAALLGAAIGAIASLTGSIGVTILQARRDERRADRDRLRANLYALQDAIDPVFQAYFAALQALWVHHEPVAPGGAPPPELTTAVSRLVMLSSRIGDEMLGKPLATLLETLAAARVQDQEHQARVMYHDAAKLIDAMQPRIGELLHTEARVDLGVTRRPISIPARH